MAVQHQQTPQLLSHSLSLARSLSQTNAVGEGQSVFEEQDASLAVNRQELEKTEGIMRVGEGKAGQFTLSAKLQSAVLTQTSYDFMTAEGKLPQSASALFGVNVLSPSSVSLAVIDSTSKKQIKVTDVVTPIKVRIGIDKSLRVTSGANEGSNWQYGISCAHYVNAPGREILKSQLYSLCTE